MGIRYPPGAIHPYPAYVPGPPLHPHHPAAPPVHPHHPHHAMLAPQHVPNNPINGYNVPQFLPAHNAPYAATSTSTFIAHHQTATQPIPAAIPAALSEDEFYTKQRYFQRLYGLLSSSSIDRFILFFSLFQQPITEWSTSKSFAFVVVFFILEQVKDTTLNFRRNIRLVSVIRAVHLVLATIVEIVVRRAAEVHVERKVVAPNHLVETIVDNADRHPIEEIAVDRPRPVKIIPRNTDAPRLVDLETVIVNANGNVTENAIGNGNETASESVNASENGIANGVDRRVRRPQSNSRLNELLFICTNRQVLGKKTRFHIDENDSSPIFSPSSRDRSRRTRSRSRGNDDRHASSSSKTEQKSQGDSIASSVTVGGTPTLSSIVETVLPENSEVSTEKDPKPMEQSSTNLSNEENSSKGGKKHKKHHHKKHRRQGSKSKKHRRSKDKDKEKKNTADSPSTAIVPVQS